MERKAERAGRTGSGTRELQQLDHTCLKNIYQTPPPPPRTPISGRVEGVSGRFGAVLAVFVVVQAVLGCASAPPLQIEYSKIVDAPKVLKNDLFVKVNLWAVGYFNKADSVIEYSDKEAGTISGKFVGNTHSIYGGMAGQEKSHNLFTISVKDEKVKLDLKPLGYIYYDNRGVRYDRTKSSIIKEADIISDYDATLASLKQAITKGSNW